MQKIPHSRNDPEILHEHDHDSVYQGHPDFVYQASDPTVTEVLAYCHHHKIPVTFCGSHTSMTGSSVANSGLALSLTRQNKILEIGVDSKTKKPFVVTEPGVILGDLKRAVLEQGYFYAPDPTSFHEAQVGATVATNATGSETFKFGPTRYYVNELEILTASGEKKTLKRTRPVAKYPIKNHAGYNLDGEDIDAMIGSEGTLGLITKLKLDLLEDVNPGRFLLILPFSDFQKCLEAVVKIVDSKQSPRALELIGPGAGSYFSQCDRCPPELKNSEIFLYVSDDFRDDQDFQKKMEAWFGFFEKLYQEVDDVPKLEQVFLAQTPKQLEDIRQCRHHVPLKVNEEYFEYIKEGAGKIGTDWWVPTKHLVKMMVTTFAKAKELGTPFLVFGHIGNGHPHWDFLTKTKQDYQKTFAFLKAQCREAVAFGGGVAGEHGIGKIKKDLLKIQHNQKILDQMRALKEKWDPNWILGRGNIVDKES